MSWDLLKRFIESEHFNNDPFLSVAYLSRYADHVGIHYVLCSKLRQFSYEEIEFFLPQLCHLIVSVDNESMALEEFILDLCEESVSGALLTFWLFQTYLHDLSGNPQSNAFRTCRRVYNKVENIVFGVSQPSRQEKLNENVLPVSVLASFVLAGAAAPFLPRYAGPLAIAQARKPRPNDETISDPNQTQKLGRSNTVAAHPKPGRKGKPGPLATSGQNLKYDVDDGPKTSRTTSKSRPLSARIDALTAAPARPPLTSTRSEGDPRISTMSLPDIITSKDILSPSPRASPKLLRSPATSSLSSPRRHSHVVSPLQPTAMSRSKKTQALRSNYFRNETQFLRALEDISNRLVIVPKPARLSALRAELALISQDLPTEVDVPLICPAFLQNGSPGRSKHHRIVRLNPAEATVLNSAERVPYLLMVEVLREDFDFDPDSDNNERLLATLVSEKANGRRKIFDLTGSSQSHLKEQNPQVQIDSVFEPFTGDLGTSPLLSEFDDEETPRASVDPRFQSAGAFPAAHPSRVSSSANTLSTISNLSTPRTSDMSSLRSNSPLPFRKMTLPASSRQLGADQPDFSALATHMRTAAQMLAQLDSSGSKRPRDEVAAIKAKIIASMQSLEEQSFYTEESSSTPTFDTIMASASTEATASDDLDLDDETAQLSRLRSGAGAARMENDQKTGGIERKGDRDDPSAATFGEEWNTKKERIRKSSPYGWMKNWDLLSVIVKTGADLRQESFACQLIQVCGKIWQDAGVPVWVKQMRILVTGESSGLVETITNGVSLHSLKRSLTLATLAAGTNPRGRIATLKDHFIKSFGEPDTDSYKAGVDAFKRSLAAYSMICYVLQLKDRHNGNILIDNQGHIIHIDFGFMLSNSPGSVGFEAVPFKLTQDYVDVLGGVGSSTFEEFKELCKMSFQALRKSADNIVMLVDMMGKHSNLPCFAAGAVHTTSSLRQRFQLQLSQDEAEQFVETDLIGKSVGSYYTRLYDTFQYRTQGIY
ncbi:MAG: hypothetical protein M1819_001137 [Sarea resinae]|nr:MAG: hypothetical protein M1819_001137 [Sarea resinae]